MVPVQGLGRKKGSADQSISLDLCRLNFSFGVKLVLAAVVAAIEPQPRQESHPRAAARALEMVDAAWAGGKQVVHSEADPGVMGPPCQALRLIGRCVLQRSILPVIYDHGTTMFAVFVIFATTCRLLLAVEA